MIILAAALTVLGPTSDAVENYLRQLTLHPEAVEFRNVRETETAVCGEIRRPNDTFRPFMFRTRDEWVSRNPTGFGGAVGRRYEASELYQGRIRAAENRGDRDGARTYRAQKERFETTARELLAVCAG